MGTPVYMSPEQAMGREFIDHRVDLFGLGITVWEALTGRRPRQESDIETMLRQAKEVPIPSIREHRSDVTREFARILESLTAINAEDRYESATVFMEDLEAYRYGRRRPYGATRGSVFIAIPYHSSFDKLFKFLQDVCSLIFTSKGFYCQQIRIPYSLIGYAHVNWLSTLQPFHCGDSEVYTEGAQTASRTSESSFAHPSSHFCGSARYVTESSI